MASFTRIPDINQGELAQQSLLLRLGLIPLFAKAVKGIIQWTLERTDGLEPATVFAILSDE